MVWLSILAEALFWTTARGVMGKEI
jgi:hypothetical protein